MATEKSEEAEQRVVLLAVDGSQNSEKAFHWYLTHFHTVQTKLILLHVYEVPSFQSGAYHISEPHSDFHSWKSRMSEVEMEAQKIMKRYLDKCTAYKDLVHYTPVTLPGRPGQVICEEATKYEADMIVIGSRGLGIISRSLFGSVSDYVVRRACRPVTVIPKGCKFE